MKLISHFFISFLTFVKLCKNLKIPKRQAAHIGCQIVQSFTVLHSILIFSPAYVGGITHRMLLRPADNVPAPLIFTFFCKSGLT